MGEIKTMKCQWGCDKEGIIYQKKHNRWTCSKFPIQCEFIKNKIKKSSEPKIKQRIEKAIKTRKYKNPITGLSIEELSHKKRVEKMKIKNKDGLSKYDIITQNLSRYKNKNIYDKIKNSNKKIGIDGLTGYQRGRVKQKEKLLKIQENGLSGYQQAARKRIETLKSIIDPITGKSYFEIEREKAHISNLKKINGLTGYERAFQSAKKIRWFKDTHLYYQSSYEYKFLEKLETKYGINWIKENVNRGPTIFYRLENEDKDRWYFPDFLIENTIYEIKSSWTWNKNGKDLELEKLNTIKLLAAKKAGYKIFLVMKDTISEFI